MSTIRISKVSIYYFRTRMAHHLIEEISATIGKQKVEQLAVMAIDLEVDLSALIDLSFNGDHQIGFRAAWILENIYTTNPARFLPVLEYFLNRFSKQDNPSARRHYAKILALMTKKNAPASMKSQLTNYDTDELVETAFAWLIDERVAVAVKSHCLNILANFVPKYPWIKEELIETMEHLATLESVAFFGKVKQIRKQLKMC